MRAPPSRRSGRLVAGYRDRLRISGERSIACGANGTLKSIASTRHASAAPFAQAEIIGAVNAFAGPRDVVVGAAGSLPGDLHKLWRAREPNTYHLEYGYSCMGYEIAGGLGVKMADPSRDVYVMVGDGSYLMMAQEIVTSIQEGYKLIVVLLRQQRLREHRRSVAIDRIGRLWNRFRLQSADRPCRQRRVAWRRRPSRR